MRMLYRKKDWKSPVEQIFVSWRLFYSTKQWHSNVEQTNGLGTFVLLTVILDQTQPQYKNVL